MKQNKHYKIEIETPIEHKQLNQNGYAIHYYISGNKNNDLIIFLHPAFGDHRCFDKQIDFFSKSYRVITIDMLGHGLSQVNKSKDKIDFSIKHIKTIIELEGHNSAHFVGVSMGSLIAQYFALKYPNYVNSLTVLGGYNINKENKEIQKAQRLESFKWLLKIIFSMNSFRRYVASVTVINLEEQVRFYKMASLFTKKSFIVMSGLGNIIKSRQNVKREYPLLILSGDKDLELAIRMSKLWHHDESKSKFFIINNAGHCANMDNGINFNKVVAGFLSDIK